MEQVLSLAKTVRKIHIADAIGMRVVNQVLSFEVTRPVTMIRNAIFEELRR